MRLFAAFLLLIFATQVPLLAREADATPASIDEIPIVLLVDLTNGQTLLERNADRRFVPASITKVMSAFTAFELIKRGELDERQRFTFRPESFAEWRRKGSTMFIPSDAQLSVARLLEGITTVSANDASVILAEGAAGSLTAWVAQMNENAAKIGITNSNFGTPNGWPDEGRTFVTARDLVKLSNALIDRHPQLYARYFGKQMLSYRGITQPNRNPLLGRVSGADGIKTGFTNQSGFGFLGSAERDGQRLAVVVAGVERSSTRDRAARDLIEWGFSHFQRVQLDPSNGTVAEARVQNGSSSKVRLETNRPYYVLVPAGADHRIEYSIHYDGPLRAPIAAGTKVAELELIVEGMPTSRIPLLAKSEVEEAGFLRRIWNGLVGWIT